MAGSLVRTLAVVLALFVARLAVAVHAEVPRAQGSPVTMEWLGWNAWRVTSPEGKVLLFNPFVTNPDSVLQPSAITQADMILVSNGHGDEVGQSLDIARNTGARIIPGSFGLGSWFMGNGIPADQVSRVSPGDRVRSGGITVRVVNNIHGSDISAPTEQVLTGGIAGAFVVTFENGYTLYYGASGAATQDMAIWAHMYQPDAAVLYMGSDKEPQDFAESVRLLQTDNPNLKTIFPGHHRYQQTGSSTTVAEVQAAMRNMGLSQESARPRPILRPHSVILGAVHRCNRSFAA